MRDRLLVRHCVVLSLPAAALFGLGSYFLVAVVPRIAASERARAAEESKELADSLKDGETPPDVVWEYGRGVVGGALAGSPKVAGRFPADMAWKDWNSRGAKRKAEMWGWFDEDGGRLVWARAGKRVYASFSGIAETDYAFWMWLLGPLLMASLAASTAFAVARLVSYAKSRDDFMAAAAHDLTTPLVGMRFLIGSDDEGARNMTERMIRLVGNIKDFLSLGGRPPPSNDEFPVGEAFGEAYRIFAADYEEEESGPVEVSGDGSLEVAADRELTTQILWNLLGNDLKYAAPYGGVRASFSADGGMVRVEIADEGPGMEPRQMKRAFDRYWRAKTALVSGKGGFGIGLCTARDFARSMGGDLTVRANEPRGCVFTLVLRRKGAP